MTVLVSWRPDAPVPAKPPEAAELSTPPRPTDVVVAVEAGVEVLAADESKPKLGVAVPPIKIKTKVK